MRPPLSPELVTSESMLTEQQVRDLYAQGVDAVVFYMIAGSRGSPALLKFFTEEFARILVTHFGVETALATFLKTSQLPTLPSTGMADG